MANKTFKIGEYCAGGIIQVITKGTRVTVIQKDWDFSTGSRKSSDQSNAEELNRIEVDSKDSDIREIREFLNNITTSYYTEQVLTYIKTQVIFRTANFW